MKNFDDFDIGPTCEEEYPESEDPRTLQAELLQSGRITTFPTNKPNFKQGEHPSLATAA